MKHIKKPHISFLSLRRLGWGLLFLLSLPTMAQEQAKDTVTFAVYGNSISTYHDFLPSGYAVYYTAARELEAGMQLGDTYWMQLSRTSGMTFLVNSSWSGSRVSSDNGEAVSPFLSTARVTSIGRYGKPDVIMIAGGTNDWGWARCKLGSYSTGPVYNDSVTFRGGYAMMLFRLQQKYPDAKIVCLSIFPRSQGYSATNSQGWTQSQGNASIKKIAQEFGCYYIDCTTVAWSSDWNKYTIDKLHPRPAGCKLLADCIRKGLIKAGVITEELARSNEVEEAQPLLDLSFDENGIVNKGTYETKVGSHGKATTLYDAEHDTWYGCSRAVAADYFYANYDAETPLANAFNNSVTWEALVRLESLADNQNTCARTCYFSSDQTGGWSFHNSQYANTFTYTHVTTLPSSAKDFTGDSIMVPGRFYHVVMTMDRTSHVMRYFINGTLVHTSTRCGTDMVLPKCGTVAGKRNMWICLGGDCTSGSSLSSCENSSASTFVFARIYNGALTEDAAKALYTPYVKQFTEPINPISDDLVLDCDFTVQGAVNHALNFRSTPIEMVGDVLLQWNESLQAYEAVFQGDKTKFFKYFLGNSPAAMNLISNAYTIEVYCQAESATPSAQMRPVGFTNSYGAGLQMTTKGEVGYSTATVGYNSEGTVTKKLWNNTTAGTLTDEYTHYLIIYDRLKNFSRLYINGSLASSHIICNKEASHFEWAPSEWLAIGGDASGVYTTAASTGSYPFTGKVAMVRIYGRSVTEADARILYNAMSQRAISYTTNSKGFAAVCVPFATVVPEGYTAYIVNEITSNSVLLYPVAEGGDVLPHGAAVVLQGPEPKVPFTLTPAAPELAERAVSLEGNLLVGTYASKELKAGESYYLQGAGTSFYRVSTNRTLEAFSCWLPYVNKRNTLTIDTTTPLRPIKSTILEPFAKNYGLSGQQVGNSYKGVVIKNGRKEIK
ncbi:MAG: hypothetical protein IKO73_06930 [Bacteroidaceae bacterium]|nr:hypothetical protein [Bacteroidaceae bacterium]